MFNWVPGSIHQSLIEPSKISLETSCHVTYTYSIPGGVGGSHKSCFTATPLFMQLDGKEALHI